MVTHAWPEKIHFVTQMLDRYEQHTLKCSSCKGAYEGFQNLQKVLIACAVLFCATTGIPSEIQLRLLLGAAAIISASLVYLLHELKKNFVFVDYVHAEIDWLIGWLVGVFICNFRSNSCTIWNVNSQINVVVYHQSSTFFIDILMKIFKYWVCIQFHLIFVNICCIYCQ